MRCNHFHPHRLAGRAPGSERSRGGFAVVALAALLVLLGTTTASAQTVRGRLVVDGRGLGVPQGLIVGSTGGRDVATTLTDSAGYFELRLPAAGSFSLRASRLGYAPSPPRVVQLAEGAVVDLVITITEEAISLDPLTVTANRGRIARDATIDGLYQRRATLPRVGGRRVFVKGDHELASAGKVGDILDRWLQVGRLAQTRCVVFFINGIPQPPLSDPRTFVREMSPDILEGLEYYRDQLSAPLDYQGHGCWAAAVYSVVAVWYER